MTQNAMQSFENCAVWVLRRTEPDRPRDKVPGGMWGLGLVSFSLAGVILIAFASQILEVGWNSIGISLALMLLGAILYIPIRRTIKPGVPDVDPFLAGSEETLF